MPGDPITDFMALPQDKQLGMLKQLPRENQDRLLAQVKARRSGPAPKASFSAEPPAMSPAGLKEKAYKARDYVVDALPSVGGIAGGLLGAAAGEGLASVPLAAAGSAAGGALGESARQYLTPEEKPMS